MNYKTHRVGGLCISFLASNLMFSGNYSAEKLVLGSVLIAGAYIGSIIPDIDHPNSYIGKRFKIVSWSVSKMCGHRGFIHSPLFWLIYTIFTMFISTYFKGFSQIVYYQFAMGSSLGFLSHLLLDSLTVSGIPLLYPFSKRMFRIAKFRTEKDEVKVTVLCIFITAIVTIIT